MLDERPKEYPSQTFDTQLKRRGMPDTDEKR